MNFNTIISIIIQISPKYKTKTKRICYAKIKKIQVPLIFFHHIADSNYLWC